MEFVLLFSFLILTLLGVPIAFSLSISVSILLFAYLGLPQVLIPQMIFAGVDSFSFMAVPFFMLAGAFMSHGGVTRRLINFANALVGPLPGGLAQVSSVAGMFFAAISGSSAATTAALGSTMIDGMEEKYGRELATGIVASSGVVGIVIPPSITMVVFGALAGVSIGGLFIGGFIPGIIMGLSMCLVSYIIAKKRKITGEGAFSFKRLFKAFKESFFALLSPVIIIGGIYSGIVTPTEAAAVGAVYGIIIGFFVYKELKLKDCPKILFEAVAGTTLIMLIVGAANVFGWMLTNLEIPHRLGAWVVSHTYSSPLVFLIFLNILLLILGTLVNASAAVVILTPIFFPVALQLGLDPIFFGDLMVINLAIGCITPPVGLDLFVASAISKVPIEKVFRAVMPYLGILIADLILFTYWSDIITFLPNLLGVAK